MFSFYRLRECFYSSEFTGPQLITLLSVLLFYSFNSMIYAVEHEHISVLKLSYTVSYRKCCSLVASERCSVK